MARYFELVSISHKAMGPVFKGSTPGQAAKKAATKGHKSIYLRERGTDKIRHYRGSVTKVALKSDTAWAKAGDKVKQSKAKFLGVIK